MAEEMERLRKELEETKFELEIANTSIIDLTSEKTKALVEVKHLWKKISENKKIIKDLSKQLEQTKESFSNQAHDYEKAAEDNKELRRKIKELEDDLEESAKQRERQEIKYNEQLQVTRDAEQKNAELRQKKFQLEEINRKLTKDINRTEYEIERNISLAESATEVITPPVEVQSPYTLTFTQILVPSNEVTGSSPVCAIPILQHGSEGSSMLSSDLQELETPTKKSDDSSKQTTGFLSRNQTQNNFGIEENPPPTESISTNVADEIIPSTPTHVLTTEEEDTIPIDSSDDIILQTLFSEVSNEAAAMESSSVYAIPVLQDGCGGSSMPSSELQELETPTKRRDDNSKRRLPVEISKGKPQSKIKEDFMKSWERVTRKSRGSGNSSLAATKDKSLQRGLSKKAWAPTSDESTSRVGTDHSITEPELRVPVAPVGFQPDLVTSNFPDGISHRAICCTKDSDKEADTISPDFMGDEMSCVAVPNSTENVNPYLPLNDRNDSDFLDLCPDIDNNSTSPIYISEECQPPAECAAFQGSRTEGEEPVRTSSPSIQGQVVDIPNTDPSASRLSPIIIGHPKHPPCPLIHKQKSILQDENTVVTVPSEVNFGDPPTSPRVDNDMMTIDESQNVQDNTSSDTIPTNHSIATVRSSSSSKSCKKSRSGNPPSIVRVRDRSHSTLHGVDHSRGNGENTGCICGKEFLRKTTLCRHIRTLTLDRKFRCELCYKKFFGLYDLKTHFTHVHKLEGALEEFPVGCSGCGIMFKSRSEFSKHLHVVHGHFKKKHSSSPSTVAKDVTPITIISEPSIKIEEDVPSNITMVAKHKVDWSKLRNGEFFCVCGHESKSKITLYLHIARQYAKKIPCSRCSRSFYRIYDIQRHMRSAHGQSFRNKGYCAKCGIMFGTLTQQNHHKRMMHATRKELVDITGNDAPQEKTGGVNLLTLEIGSETSKTTSTKIIPSAHSLKCPDSQLGCRRDKASTEMSVQHSEVLRRSSLSPTPPTWSHLLIRTFGIDFDWNRQLKVTLERMQVLPTSTSEESISVSEEIGADEVTTRNQEQESVSTINLEVETSPNAATLPLLPAAGGSGLEPETTVTVAALDCVDLILTEPISVPQQGGIHETDNSKASNEHFCVCGSQFSDSKSLRRHILDTFVCTEEEPTEMKYSKPKLTPPL